MPQNQFAGGYQVSEKLPEGNPEGNNKNPRLKDLNGTPLSLEGGGLFKPFTPESQKKLLYTPYSAIVNRLYDKNNPKKSLIGEDSYYELIDYLSGLDGKNPDFSGLKLSDKVDQKIIKSYFERYMDGKNKKENLSNMIGDTKKIPEFSDFKLGKDGTFEMEFLNKIGENYVNFPDGDGNIDYQKDLQTAILKTRSDIISEVKNINLDSQTYKTAIKNIDSGDLKTQIEGIESLYILAYSNEGVLGKTQIDTYKEKRKNRLIQEGIKLENEIETAKQSNNTKLQEKLELKKQEIIKEISEITGILDGKKVGDIFNKMPDNKDGSNKGPKESNEKRDEN
ncbi:MAG: hypothetical protein PHI37_00360 [Candidatus Gracilibacteria bacterium]|nr:hypothetical protein [Candidatus Gracilibacteria bacterium]